MTDYFDWYSWRAGHYRCGIGKRVAMRTGRLEESGSGSYQFLGDDGASGSQPLNWVLDVMLSHFRARYQGFVRLQDRENSMARCYRRLKHILARRRAGEAPTESGEDDGKDQDQDTLEDQEKSVEDTLLIDSHAELLEFLDEALEWDWPKKDVVGDQLKKEPSAPAPRLQSRLRSGDNKNTASQILSGRSRTLPEPDDLACTQNKRDPDEPTAKRRRIASAIRKKGRLTSIVRASLPYNLRSTTLARRK